MSTKTNIKAQKYMSKKTFFYITMSWFACLKKPVFRPDPLFTEFLTSYMQQPMQNNVLVLLSDSHLFKILRIKCSSSTGLQHSLGVRISIPLAGTFSIFLFLFIYFFS